MQDISKELNLAIALNATAISSNTTTAGTAIDLQGYEALLLEIRSHAWTDGTYTPLVEESDASGSGYTAVADDDLTILEADAAIGAANTVKKIGYVGHKRYVRLSIVSTGVTSGANIGATAIRGHARHNPVA
jgi:hypothetical protein